jgi:putative glutamine amidotransferase
MRGAAAVVGLTAGRADARWGPWSGPAFLLPAAYVRAVERAGAVAVMLPAAAAAAQTPALLVERLDALVLTGGCDVEPAAYGARAQPGTGAVDPVRDGFELALAREAFRRDLPLLATCRGMQVMNVALGGTLVQHLAGPAGELHRRAAGRFGRHPVRLAAGSLAARVAGEERHLVDSHHHQAVDRVAPGLRVTGRADDGLVEAVEDPSRGFALGVQWHPEEDEASGVIAALVAHVRGRGC